MRSLLLSLVVPGLMAVEPGLVSPVHRLDAQGSLRLELVDHLQHPHFWWPRTLVTYRVAWDPAVTDPARWVLTDAAGAAVPFQVAGVSGPSATLSFVTDLPSGARRDFALKTAAPVTPAAPKTVTNIQEAADGVVLSTGVIQVRLPVSQVVTDPARVPGPLAGIEDGHGWLGRSALITPGKAVERITTRIIERGALRSRAEVAYTLVGGGTYTVTATAVAGYDFIRWDEAMAGLPAGSRVEVDWTGFSPTNRRGKEPIAGPKIITFRGEDPYFVGPDRIEDASKEMYVHLAPTYADSTISTPALDFTDAVNNRSLGVAVIDHRGWDDGAYALWASGPDLALRFRYANNLLSWTMPLVAKGHRSLALAAYDPRADTAAAKPVDENDPSVKNAIANSGRPLGRARIDFIAHRFGDMGLDVVKDWQLTYDGPHHPAHGMSAQNGKPMSSAKEWVKALWESKHEALSIDGTWGSPVGLRVMGAWIVPGFDKFRDELSEAERRRATALLLFQAYYAASEGVSPMLRVLKGHPNFMADWKYPLLAGTYLFPQHPQARAWADQFQQLMHLMGTFWVRPDVNAWEAKGGRWCESIAVYNWAFLEPSVKADDMGRAYDGRPRMATEGIARHGDYLVGIATAPVKLGKDGETNDVPSGTALTPANGFQRIHPAQGAHGGRRAVPGSAYELGDALDRYRPHTAEHLRWLSRRPGQDGRDQGTNPRLTSAKYTGYGIVLRAAVDTPDEVSVFLQQIDQGPNYRWGFANEGGCGDLYYYAAGKSFSGHLGEDTGDRRTTDAELTCNTGVYKDQTFRGIGMNELTEPLYDLEAAQFATLLPRQRQEPYAWPEYQSRSAFLVGADYVLTFDVLNGCSRTAWSYLKDQDAEPVLQPLRGEVGFKVRQENTGRGHAGGTSISQRFDCYKGAGDRVLLASHKPGVTGANRKLGGGEVFEVVQGKGAAEVRDHVVLQREDGLIEDKALSFQGRTGLVRRRAGAVSDLVLVQGTRVAADGYALTVSRDDLGVSATVTGPDDLRGVAFGRQGGTLTITRPGKGAVRVAIDGAPVEARQNDQNLVIDLPPGRHRWQVTTGPIEPMPAQITTSVALKDGVRIQVASVPSATAYTVERSDDGGTTWKAVGQVQDGAFTLSGVAAPAKFHLRVVAMNGTVAARPGRDWPVRVTGQPVPAPAGLRLALGQDRVDATWGEILGAKAYVLYRQRAGETTWQEVYRGPAQAFTDTLAGVRPAAEVEAPVTPWATYAVAAVDGVGESSRSETVPADPASWATWQAPVPPIFRRQTTYWLPPYVRPTQVPDPFYPR